MRRLLGFLFGILILGLTFVILYFSGALYSSTDQRHIDPFIFQPNDISADRIGRPQPLEELTDKFVRERLIKKFVIEYFYVNPDVENIAQRTRPDSVLAALAHRSVFKEWQQNEARRIEDMATEKYMRTVTVANEIIQPAGSDYWIVHYELKTWDKPNNMELIPTVHRGIMHLKIEFEKGVRDLRGGQKFDVQKYLNDGGDPAAIFKFRVDEVRR